MSPALMKGILLRIIFALLLAAVCRAQDASSTDEEAKKQAFLDSNPLAIENAPEPSQYRGRRVQDTFVLPRLTSPRATWDSFNAVMAIYAKKIISEGYTSENYEQLTIIEKRMETFFDMREVPPSVRRSVAAESAVYLYETFARFTMAGAQMLPDRDQAFKEMKDGYPGVWTVEDGVIAIIYVDSGDYKGSFQFSYRTLESADFIYESVKNLSYINLQVEGLHDAYFLNPGPLIPAELVRDLPQWMHQEIYKQSVWQWMAMFLVGVLLLTGLLFFSRVVNRVCRNWPRLFRSIARLFVPAAVITATTMATNFLAMQVFISGDVLRAVRFIEWLVLLFMAVCVVFIIGNIVSEAIIRSRHFKGGGIDASLVRFIVKIFSIIVAAAVVIEGATMLGFTVTTVLAGAGVTGLAIALAAQESLRNVFGSVMLLLDKPFKVGQRVIVRGHDGIIENIGLRSTKIRLLTGNLTTIPNEDVAKADIENVGERQHIRRLLRLHISLSTPPEKIDEALVIIRDLLAVKEGDAESAERNGPVNHPDFPPRVNFETVASYAFQIIVIYWYHPPDYWAYMAFSEKFNRDVVEHFAAAGIELAVPTQRSYFTSRVEAISTLQDPAVPSDTTADPAEVQGESKTPQS